MGLLLHDESRPLDRCAGDRASPFASSGFGSSAVFVGDESTSRVDRKSVGESFLLRSFGRVASMKGRRVQIRWVLLGVGALVAGVVVVFWMNACPMVGWSSSITDGQVVLQWSTEIPPPVIEVFATSYTADPNDPTRYSWDNDNSRCCALIPENAQPVRALKIDFPACSGPDLKRDPKSTFTIEVGRFYEVITEPFLGTETFLFTGTRVVGVDRELLKTVKLWERGTVDQLTQAELDDVEAMLDRRTSETVANGTGPKVTSETVKGSKKRDR